MTNEEAIKYLKQLYPNGGCSWLDEQRIEAISMAVDALKVEPVSEDLDDVADRKFFENAKLNSTGERYEIRKLGQSMFRHFAHYFADWQKEREYTCYEEAFEDGCKWQKEQMIKDAIDATVYKTGNTYLKGMDRDAIVKALEPYKDGDKVKVIIKAQKGE